MAAKMNASAEAYEWLEGREPGSYERLVGYALGSGGVMVQAPEFFLVFCVEDGCAHILFAYGSIGKMMRYVKRVADVFGYDRASWERSLVGKHEGRRTYKVNKLHLCKKEQDTV